MTALTDKQLDEKYRIGRGCMSNPRLGFGNHFAGLRAVAEAAVKAAREGQEPVGYMVTHPSGFKSMVWVDEPDMLELAKSAKFDVTAIYTTQLAAPGPEEDRKYAAAVVAAFGPDEGIHFEGQSWAKLHKAISSLLAANKQEK